MKNFISKWNSISLVLRIIIGLSLGFLLAVVQIQLTDDVKCNDSNFAYVEIAEENVCVDEAAYNNATDAELAATEDAIKAEKEAASAEEGTIVVEEEENDLVLEYVLADEETTNQAYTTAGKIASGMTTISILGTLFVGALKAIAPLLVFFLVMEAITKHKKGQKTNMKHIIALYLVGTFLAAVVAVFISFASPVELALKGVGAEDIANAPTGLVQVLETLLLNVVANPLDSIANANYIGVLFWALVIALALKTVKGNETTVNVISSIAQSLGQVVRWVINFAPFGIMGLIFDAISTTGIKAMASYGHLIIILVGSMLIVALVVNPIIAFIGMRKNPYPLVLKCLKDSGLTAFFTRSSAANIPVNMELCEELGLDEDTYAISIPLGATINMAGAAITITVLTLAAANTVGIDVSIPQALFLSFLAALSACGASGVAGGSLLLIPLACSLFNIDADIAAQVIGVGFIVGVIQDSCETALNSSTDVLFTAVADYSNKRRESKDNA